MREWEQTYNRGVEGYATCEFVDAFGSPEIDSQIAAMVDLHDPPLLPRGQTAGLSGLSGLAFSKCPPDKSAPTG